MVHDLKPEMPVQCLRPATIAATAKRFLKAFPGDVLYAVKTNPDPRVLGYLARAGVKHYDVASLAEVKLAAAIPDAKLYFMHPVKSREAIAASYDEYGVRDFSLDSHEELEKILDATSNASDLNLYVRLSIPSEGAVYSLAGKFGVALEQAASLLAATRKAASRLGVCFHVGSQCMNPEAFSAAIQMVADLLVQTDVRLDILDIGGGFPSIYPGMTPPPLTRYMKAIKKTLQSLPQLAECQVLCEPGRALVAEGGSVVVRVELRKGNMLYLNDGVYGSLFDAGSPGFVFPVKAIRPRGQLSAETAEFGFFGPTCDSIDAMKGPFVLPADIREGDWIEIGQLGAYGATMRTRFNGFYSDLTVEVADKPLLSMTGVH
ncbi:MAG: type III PLP-dependent enzyme [Pseudomonadota bacterium]|nr:type III PLP-dependent enzyme [Pseudomonadota bacterium]